MNVIYNMSIIALGLELIAIQLYCSHLHYVALIKNHLGKERICKFVLFSSLTNYTTLVFERVWWCSELYAVLMML